MADQNLDVINLTIDINTTAGLSVGLFVYLGDYTPGTYESVGSPGLSITIDFPSIATPLNSSTDLGVVSLSVLPIPIYPYISPHSSEVDESLTNLIDTINSIRLEGWAPDFTGDASCELSNLLNNIRDGVAHTPVGDSNCTLSSIIERLVNDDTVDALSSPSGDCDMDWMLYDVFNNIVKTIH